MRREGSGLRRVALGAWRALLAAALLLVAAKPGVAQPTATAQADTHLSASAEAFIQGQLDRAAAEAKKAEDVYTSLGFTPGRIDAALNLGAAQQAKGQYLLAGDSFARALDLAQLSSDHPRRIAAHNALASVYTFTRQFNAAQAELDKALVLARRQRDHAERPLALIRLNLGNLQSVRGEHALAQASYAAAVESAAAAKDDVLVAQGAVLRASVAAAAAAVAGDVKKAPAGKFADADRLNGEARAALARAPRTHSTANLLITSGRTDAALIAADDDGAPDQKA